MANESWGDIGQTLQKNQAVISVGIITGSTPDKARLLWQRKLVDDDKHLAIIPREHQIQVVENGQTTAIPLSKDDFITTIQQADYVTFQGHGSRRHAEKSWNSWPVLAVLMKG